MLTRTGTYDDALERFHRTGPEFDGFLSNHGPMVVELLARRDVDDEIGRWTDDYLTRLDELPRGTHPIDAADWGSALGDVDRSSDWIEFMLHELADEPWHRVLTRWWPRLLPGIAAGATHGVIRVGHAVRALREAESAPRVAELAHALGYWAARWQAVPRIVPAGRLDAAAVAPGLARVARQTDGIRPRLAQLAETAGWADQVASLAAPLDIPSALDHLVDTVVGLYPSYAYGNPTMLVHAATAPNAVSMALPALPSTLWRSSFDLAWTASAAVIAAYAPRSAGEITASGAGTDEVLARALRHGGEHVLKFADTALRSYDRTGDPLALDAALTAVRLDA